ARRCVHLSENAGQTPTTPHPSPRGADGQPEHGSLAHQATDRPPFFVVLFVVDPRRPVFDSVSYVAANSALDGLALRQRVIANNVANLNTPGYLAQRVSFERELAQAVRSGSG